MRAPMFPIGALLHCPCRNGTGQAAVRAIKAGATDYIAKPVDLLTLLAAVESALEGVEAADTMATFDALQRAAVERAMAAQNGHRPRAARSLGISLRTLQR